MSKWSGWAQAIWLFMLVIGLIGVLSLWVVPTYGMQITYISRPFGSNVATVYLYDLEQQQASLVAEGPGLQQFLWSPDGRYLLLNNTVSVQWDDGTGRSYDQLHIYDPATRRQWMLVEDAFAYGAASWSPDSQRVVYTRASEHGVGVFTIDLYARDERLLTVTETYPWYPSWSSDGSEIAFTDYFDNLYVVSAQGGEARALGVDMGGLPCGRRFLKWSASSDRLIYCREDTLYTVAVDQPEEQVLAARLNSAPDVFSDDRIAITTTDRVPAAVDVISLSEQESSSYSLPDRNALMNPLWSPDGRFLLVTDFAPRYEAHTPRELFRLDTVTGEWMLLTTVLADQVAWRPLSPDAALR